MKRLAWLFLVGFLLTLGLARPQAQAAVSAQIANFWTLLKSGGTDPTTQITYAFTNEALVASGYISWGTTRGASGYGIRDSAGTMQVKNSGGAWAAFLSSSGNLCPGDGTTVIKQVATNDLGIYTGDDGVRLRDDRTKRHAGLAKDHASRYNPHRFLRHDGGGGGLHGHLLAAMMRRLWLILGILAAMLVGVMTGIGCGPHCHQTMLTMYWEDGTTSQWPITVCRGIR